jgi:hypothetical protein
MISRKSITFFYVIFIALFFVTSCSVEKRVYRKGYHVVWNNKHSNEIKKNERLNTTKTPLEQEISKEEVIVLTSREADLLPFIKKRAVINLDKDTCGDVLLLQNADEIAVKILEIDERNIKYKRCDNINGPTYSISKSRVALIKYANGTKEVVMPEPAYKVAEQDKPPKPEMPRKVNPLGLASLLLYLLGSILFRGLTASAYSGSMLVFLLILSIAPLIMAYISLFQFKREPNRYKGKWMPITVVCIYLAAFLILALFLAALGVSAGGGAGIFVAISLIFFFVLLGVLIAALIPNATPPTNAK